MPLRYSKDAAASLDLLEATADDDLWNAVCDALDLIAEHADRPEARRESLRTTRGNTVWRIPVRSRNTDGWCVLWTSQGEVSYIIYVGVM